MRIYSGVIACSLIVAVFTIPGFVYSATTTANKPTAKEKESSTKGYKEIHTEELKKIIDSKKPVVILDARKKITVGVIPGAKHLAYDADAKVIERTLGSIPKDSMIVVYCARLECPLSKYLAESLVSIGYTHVYKYPEGIEEWMKTNSIDKI